MYNVDEVIMLRPGNLTTFGEYVPFFGAFGKADINALEARRSKLIAKKESLRKAKTLTAEKEAEFRVKITKVNKRQQAVAQTQFKQDVNSLRSEGKFVEMAMQGKEHHFARFKQFQTEARAKLAAKTQVKAASLEAKRNKEISLLKTASMKYMIALKQAKAPAEILAGEQAETATTMSEIKEFYKGLKNQSKNQTKVTAPASQPLINPVAKLAQLKQDLNATLSGFSGWLFG